MFFALAFLSNSPQCMLWLVQSCLFRKVDLWKPIIVGYSTTAIPRSTRGIRQIFLLPKTRSVPMLLEVYECLEHFYQTSRNLFYKIKRFFLCVCGERVKVLSVKELVKYHGFEYEWVCVKKKNLESVIWPGEGVKF